MSYLGIGDWGLGVGVLGPIPNPQSPIPNPHLSLEIKDVIRKLGQIKIFN